MIDDVGWGGHKWEGQQADDEKSPGSSMCSKIGDNWSLRKPYRHVPLPTF